MKYISVLAKWLKDVCKDMDKIDRENLIHEILQNLYLVLNERCKKYEERDGKTYDVIEEYHAITSISPIFINSENALMYHVINKFIIGQEMFYCKDKLLYNKLYSECENKVIWDYELPNNHFLCLLMGEGNAYDLILKERISKALKVVLNASDVIDERTILETLKWLKHFPVKDYITNEFKTKYQKDNRIDFARSIESFLKNDLKLDTSKITPRPFRSFCELLFDSEISEDDKNSLNTAWNRARKQIP